MIRRTFAALAVSAALMGAGTLPAVAQEYPPAEPTVSVSAASAEQGELLTVQGAGFFPSSEVAAVVSVGDEICGERLKEANAQGEVTFTFKLKCTGNNLITLFGFDTEGEEYVVQTEVFVAGGGAGRPGTDGGSAGGGTDNDGLAETGGSVVALWSGLGLLAAGGGALAVSRRRRES